MESANSNYSWGIYSQASGDPVRKGKDSSQKETVRGFIPPPRKEYLHYPMQDTEWRRNHAVLSWPEEGMCYSAKR